MVPSRRVLYASCAVIGLVAAGGGGWVLADDFVISTPVTTTNGGNTVDGDDTITVTGTGSVTTAGTDGLFATGTDNTITNNGSVTTSGGDLNGIYAEDGNTITNSGSVTTSGSNVDGIFAEDGNTITNSGSVTTSGSNAEGIVAIGNNTITNSGSVTTLGPNSEGIYAEAGITMITNSGTVSTSGDTSDGISAEDGATITNSGSVTTSDESSRGIVGRHGNTVTNFGTIMTLGRFSSGILARDDNEITNSGTITTHGTHSDGVVLDDDNRVTNSGLIATFGDFSEGILGDSDNEIWNHGTISTSGSDAPGIEVDFRNTIVNSGTISTHGDDSHGIEASDENTIFNTGMITTTGSGAAAILAGSDHTVTNSGRIVSVQSDAIRFRNSRNTLNLHPSSFLGGRIDLGSGTIVNIVSGPSHSILWDLSTGSMDGGAPTLSGPVPIFYNSATRQVATFDPTALSASANALGDMSGNLSALMRQRLSASQSGGGDAADASFVSAYAAADENAGVSAIDRIAAAFADTTDADTGWWVSGFGSFADYDGSAATLDHSFDHSGVAAGYDWQPSSDLTLGVMAGYGMGSFDTDSRFANAFDNSADGVFAAFYGRADFAHSMFVDFALSGGLLSHSDNRFVNDNLAPLGVSSASADYTSWWLSPEMTLGMDFDDVMGSDWRFTPSAGVRYAMQSLDDYTETGPSAANATVSARDVALLETRLELAGRRDIQLATFSGHLTGRLGWQHRAAMGDDGTTIAMIGQTNTVGASGQDDSSAYLGFDAALDIGNSASLALGGDYRVGAHSDAYRGTATLTVTF
jgi:uncharacterized protein with beta-barrel porin domain